jgi:hypothetical protein
MINGTDPMIKTTTSTTTKGVSTFHEFEEELALVSPVDVEDCTV